ncbi:hypothetical protein ANCCAN_18249, partial [Ancylostoma caninum]
MGKTLEDVKMRESSDEDEEVQQVEPVSHSLREVTEMLRGISEVISREIAEHKISSRYKERHFETLKREIDVVCSKVERLEVNCRMTRVLHEKLFESLNDRGIESKEDWAQYMSTIERDGEMLAELCDILGTDMLQIMDAVKDIKAKAESAGAGRNGKTTLEMVQDTVESGANWTVLRARMEAMCADIMGKPTRGN